MSAKTKTDSEMLSGLYGKNYEILAVEEVDGILYAAVKNRTSGAVTATIGIRHPKMAFTKHEYDGWDEYENPPHRQAPASILNLLTESNWAGDKWRAHCWKNIAKAQAKS